MATDATMPDDGDMTNITPTRTRPRNGLHRSRDDRVIAGVAGGLGAQLGVNPWWFRFAFIILAFFGGFGFLVYAVAWLVIPDEGDREPIVSRWIRRLDMSDGAAIFGIVLVGVAGVIVLAQFTDVPGVVVVAAVLFVVGLLLYRGDLTTGGPAPDTPRPETLETDVEEVGESEITSGDHAPEETDMDATVTLPGSPMGPGATTPTPPAPPTAERATPSYPPPPPYPKRESSMLGRLTIAIDLIVLATMAMIDLAFARVDIEPVHYLATAIAILGVGLLVGTFMGRARWLILVGLFIVPALWVATWWPGNVPWTAGEISHRPTVVAEVETPYEQGFGQMTIDLTGLTTEDLEAIGTIRASLGAGQMIVRVPNEAGISLSASVGMGAVEGPFDQASGIGVDVTREFGPSPTIVELDLEVGAGQIVIEERVFVPGGLFEGSN